MDKIPYPLNAELRSCIGIEGIGTEYFQACAMKLLTCIAVLKIATAGIGSATPEEIVKTVHSDPRIRRLVSKSTKVLDNPSLDPGEKQEIASQCDVLKNEFQGLCSRTLAVIRHSIRLPSGSTSR